MTTSDSFRKKRARFEFAQAESSPCQHEHQLGQGAGATACAAARSPTGPQNFECVDEIDSLGEPEQFNFEGSEDVRDIFRPTFAVYTEDRMSAALMTKYEPAEM